MRFVHISDTHLGHTAYTKLDENGYNQREADVFDAFKQGVDKALALKVDAVLHTGDLFDSIRPSNRAMHFALEQILRLSEAEVPFVAIAGNHSSPRLRETGSVFRLFEHLKGVRVVYAGAYEQVDVGDVAVHCVPHCATQDAFAEEVRKVSPLPGKTNVAMLHCGVSGVERFAMGEFNENLLPSGQLWPEMEYIALGHFHDRTIVAANAAYAGSTERMSFNEAGKEKGVVEVSVPRMSMEFHGLKIREMVDFGKLDCAGLTNADIIRTVEGRLLSSKADGKIMRIRLTGIPRSQVDGLDQKRLRSAVSGALHFELRIETLEECAGAQGTQAAIGDLRNEFEAFVSGTPVERLDKAELLKLGRGYIDGAMNEAGG
ncbi:MAG: exonuclease SbcCD subunit D [Methanobacteriota archaeon]